MKIVKNVIENKKIISITAIALILYTFFLFLIGIFGETIQQHAIEIGLFLLKYGLIVFGFVIAGFLPIRIAKALQQRKDEKYQRESERKIIEAANAEKKKQEKILEEMYIKNEDAL